MMEELVKLAQAGGPVAVMIAVGLLVKASERLARIEKALDEYMKENGNRRKERHGNHETTKKSG